MNSKVVSVLIVAALAIASARAVAAPPALPPAIDPQADTVLHGLSEHFKTVTSFKVELEARTRLESADMKQEFTTRATLMVKRPARLAMTVKNPMIGSLVLACDGNTFISFLPTLKRYTVQPAPKNLELLSQDMGAASPVCLPVVSALLERDPYDALVKDTSRIAYLGQEKRGDAECHHLAFTNADYDCEAWITAGPRPVLVAVKPGLDKMTRPSAFPADMNADVWLTLNAWEIDTPIPDAAFVLVLPEEARKVDTLFPAKEEADDGIATAAMADADPPLRLKPAPAFTLPLLGGGTFDLAAHKGKSPVMALFWTSWAGPCRLLLPVFDKLARAYKDKGLVCVSINEQEAEDAVTAFLRDLGLAIPVALDADSRTAALYQIAGIPQLVLIDKAGVVRESYIGYGTSLEDEVRVVLDALTDPEPAPPGAPIGQTP